VRTDRKTYGLVVVKVVVVVRIEVRVLVKMQMCLPWEARAKPLQPKCRRHVISPLGFPEERDEESQDPFIARRHCDLTSYPSSQHFSSREAQRSFIPTSLE
jgi:hypothetical protein